METEKRRWRDFFTSPGNVVLVLWMMTQGGVYVSQWVWAKDMTVDRQAQQINDLKRQLEEQYKFINSRDDAQQEAINVQHTFAEVVSVRLTSIDRQLDELKALIKEVHR